jgi:hypothetical protein
MRTSARAFAKGSLPMAMSYVSVTEKNLTKGINQLAVEDAIPDGYVEDALNVDISSGGTIQKRTGYVNHLGELPLRAESIQFTSGAFPTMAITFPVGTIIDSPLGSHLSIWIRPQEGSPSILNFPSGVFTSESGVLDFVSLDKRTIRIGVQLFGAVPSHVVLSPDCVVYGLSTASTQINKGAYLHHIDSLVSTSQTDILRTLVCGMGTDLFVEQTKTAQFKIPSFLNHISLRGTIPANQTIVTGFSSSSSSTFRIKFDGGGEGWANINKIQFNSLTNLFDVYLDTPNIQETFLPVSIRTLQDGVGGYNTLCDALTIQNSEFKVLDGQWEIHTKTVAGTTEFVLGVHIQAALPYGADLNCGATGLAGVFTQVGTFSFVSQTACVGDSLYLPAQPEIGLSLFGNGTTEAVLNNVTETTTIVPQAYQWTHKGYIHQFTENLSYLPPTKGSTLNFMGVPFEVKKSVRKTFSLGLNPFSPSTNGMIVSAGVGTIFGPELSGESFVDYISAGDVIKLRRAGMYSIECVVSSVSPTILIVDLADMPDTFTKQPVFIELGVSFYESIDTKFSPFEDFVCEGLWRPLTSPSIDKTIHNLLSNNYQKKTRAFPYNNQPTLRSVALNNTLYLNNGTDDALAFDGFAARRAGLFPWKPIHTVNLIPGTALVAGSKYRYYARLEYVDQNGQLQAGNTSSANDFKVTSPVGGAFASFTLALPPLFAGNLLEYDRFFISLYRTQANELPFVLTGEQFHLVERIPLTFSQESTFIYFTDKMTDSVLGTQPADNLIERTRGLAGSTLQLASDFAGPPRALFNTTLNGRLFLANSRDYPSAEITFSGQYDWSTIGTNVTLSLLRDGTVTIPAPNTIDHLRFELQNVAPASTPLTAYSYNGATGELTVALSAGFPGQFCWVWDDTSTNKQVAGFLHMKNVGGSMVAVQKGLGTTSFVGTARFLATANIPVPLFTDNLFGQGLDTTASLSTKSSTLYRIATVMSMAQQGINKTFSGWSGFSPMMTVVAGNDLANTESILFSLPTYSSTTPAVKLSNRFNWGGLTSVYVRGEALVGDFTALLLEKRHISRVHFSFPDFPEVFSVASYADINAADGQAITGIIPFFSNGTNVGAGAAGQEANIVVFKTNSIYLLKVNPNGTTAVVKLETQGLGCTAPYSIAPTNNGIMFANETGIYRLGQNNQIEPIGRNIERLWKDFYATQEQEGLLQAYGHHFGKERTYRLSLPLKDSLEPTDSLAYNHTNEGRGELGAWSRHSQMPFLQWCNLLSQEYVASTKARVYRKRNFQSIHDYVDGEGFTIPAQVDTRMTDFGDPSTRKRVLHLTCTFRTPIERGAERNLPISGTTVAMAINQSCLFLNAQEYVTQGNALTAGLSDIGCIKADTIRYSLADTKSSHFQVRLVNNELYSPFELSSISYRVAGLTTKGETEAVDTSTKAGRRIGYISGALTPRRN